MRLGKYGLRIWACRFLLLCGSVVFSLVLLEVGLRVFAPYKSHGAAGGARISWHLDSRG